MDGVFQSELGVSHRMPPVAMAACTKTVLYAYTEEIRCGNYY
jgi:hypothetical protein